MEIVPDIQLKEENNKVILVGEVIEDLKISHETFNEKFYSFKISVKRLSGDTDELEIVISEKILNKDIIKVGNTVVVDGEIRSYNYIMENEERRKLILSVFAKEVREIKEEDLTTNEVTLIGYICKKPIYRKTPFGREIADILLAVNRIYGKDTQEADFINIVAWNKTAEIVSTYLTKGNLIALAGRIQTRDYDGKDGKRVYVTEVVAEEIFFTGGTNNNYTPKTKIEEEFEIEEEPEIDFEELNNEIETMEW